MAKVMVTLTEQSFIHGVLRPEGYVVEVDEAELGAKVGAIAKPAEAVAAAPIELTPNLQRVGKGGAPDPIAYEVAAISPTGPNPTQAQATPPGAQPDGVGGFAVPPEADGVPAAVVPEVAADAKATKTK